jgi:glycosyltransferase involved in cell wall biosynthesis
VSTSAPESSPPLTTPSQRPRVAIITRSIDRSGTSGSGHHLREMVRHLIPAATDIEFVLAHYDHSDDEIYSLAQELILPVNPLRAAAHLNRAGVDVVHFSPLSIVAPIHGLRAKRVATKHSSEPTLYPEGYSWVMRAHERLIVPRYVRKLDALITVSETSKAWFAERYRVAPEQIHVTFNACAPAYRVLPGKEGTPRPIPEPYIFHVSRFSPRKNPLTMLTAFADLVARGNGIPENLKLVIAGTRWDTEEVSARAAELGITNRLVLLGFVEEERVVELMNHAELFWFPSLSEGFGMPNIEAMRCGCPVITTAVFAVPEIVGNAAVVLPDPRDTDALVAATVELLTNHAHRDQLVERGLAWCERYSWKASARVLANVYRELTGLPAR